MLTVPVVIWALKGNKAGRLEWREIRQAGWSDNSWKLHPTKWADLSHCGGVQKCAYLGTPKHGVDLDLEGTWKHESAVVGQLTAGAIFVVSERGGRLCHSQPILFFFFLLVSLEHEPIEITAKERKSFDLSNDKKTGKWPTFAQQNWTYQTRATSMSEKKMNLK